MKVRKQAASLLGKTKGLGKVLFGKKNADEEVKIEEESGEGNKRKGGRSVSTGENLEVGQRSIRETRRRLVRCRECPFRRYELALMPSVNWEKRDDTIKTHHLNPLPSSEQTMTIDTAP
jgi:hypothetical protein